MPAHTWEFPSMSLIVARSHLLSKALLLCISKGRMSEWKLSLVSNLFSHPFTIHPLNLQVHPCSVQQQASVKSSRRLFFTGTPHTYLFRLFFDFECQTENQEILLTFFLVLQMRQQMNEMHQKSLLCVGGSSGPLDVRLAGLYRV